jgi:hypothetical protein
MEINIHFTVYLEYRAYSRKNIFWGKDGISHAAGGGGGGDLLLNTKEK